MVAFLNTLLHFMFFGNTSQFFKRYNIFLHIFMKLRGFFALFSPIIHPNRRPTTSFYWKYVGTATILWASPGRVPHAEEGQFYFLPWLKATWLLQPQLELDQATHKGMERFVLCILDCNTPLHFPFKNKVAIKLSTKKNYEIIGDCWNTIIPNCYLKEKSTQYQII